MSESTGVIISGIVPKGDDLNQNVDKVNGILKKTLQRLQVRLCGQQWH